jgi:hypothetical protein
MRVLVTLGVSIIEPDWVGKLAGFTLKFEALVLMLAQQSRRYVVLAHDRADLSALTSVAIDETSAPRSPIMAPASTTHYEWADPPHPCPRSARPPCPTARSPTRWPGGRGYPPYGRSRPPIEKAIDAEGFQLWRLRDKTDAQN